MTNLRNIDVNNFPLTAFGDLRTAELSPIFQQSFEYTVDNTALLTNVIANGGTVTQADAMAVVTSSTTTASSAEFRSVRHAKYRSGLGGLSRFTAIFTAGVAGTEQYIGLTSVVGSSAAFKDGYMIGFDGDTFGFHRFQNDVKISVAQSAWDDPLDGTGASGMTLDPTKLNVWSIRFQYLGGGAITLQVEDDSTGALVTVHTVLYANLNTVPSVYNPNFHFTGYVNNLATTSNVVLKCASFAYFVEGKSGLTETQQPQFSSGEQTKTTVTTEVALFTLRNKTTYASKANFIDIILERIVISIEASSANNLGDIRLVRNTTLGGSPSYADINATNSVIEIDTAGTTLTGGEELLFAPLAGKNDSNIESLLPYKIFLTAGDTITVAGKSANSATINAAMLWKELF